MASSSSSATSSPIPVVQVEHQQQQDRFGALPRSILLRILSFLPTLDAVRTSVLSTRWRTLWTSVGALDLDEKYNRDFFSGIRTLTETRRTSRSRFAEFVGSVLSVHHTTPTLHKLRLSCCTRNFPLKDWVIHTAVSRGVQALDLRLPPHSDSDGNVGQLPSLLFTSQSLVDLRLDLGGSALILPGTMALFGLRRLRLCCVKFCDDQSTRALFSSSTALRILALENCNYEKLGCLEISCSSLQQLAIEDGSSLSSCLVKIDAPHLISFVYRASVAHIYAVKSLVCVEYVKIQFQRFEAQKELDKPSILDQACSFLCSFSSARNLELCPVCVEALLWFRRKICPLYVIPFSNLNVLRVAVKNLDYSALHVVLRLLLVNPQLRALIVQVGGLSVLPSSWGVGKHYFLKDLARCFESGSGVLERVEIRCSTDSTSRGSSEVVSYTTETVLQLVKVLLGSQAGLNKLILSTRFFCNGYSPNSSSRRVAVMEKVLSFPKLSCELAVAFI